MQNIALKQLSVDMGKPEYDMLRGISAVENGKSAKRSDIRK
jgi:hypothetical protein